VEVEAGRQAVGVEVVIVVGVVGVEVEALRGVRREGLTVKSVAQHERTRRGKREGRRRRGGREKRLSRRR
jgi:hypothetical protein